MKIKFTIICLMLIISQLNAGQAELMEREKQRLLEMRELVLKALPDKKLRTSQKSLSFKVRVIKREKVLLIKAAPKLTAGKEENLRVALAGKFKTVALKPTRKEKKTFYNDMKYINP